MYDRAIVPDIRDGHGWYTGSPPETLDELPRDKVEALSGKFVACPGCTRDAFETGNCHLVALFAHFAKTCPGMEPPKFASLATKTVEGKGGLRDVLLEKDAIFGGCKPARGSPHSSALGVKLKCSIFGNPEVEKRLKESRLRAAEKRARKIAQARE